MMTESLSPLTTVWRHYRATIGFIFLAAFMVFVYWRVDIEADERKAEDGLRQYDICLESNERTTNVNKRFDNLDRLLVSFSDPSDPRIPLFLEKERAATIPLRDCEELRPK